MLFTVKINDIATNWPYVLLLLVNENIGMLTSYLQRGMEGITKVRQNGARGDLEDVL